MNFKGNIPVDAVSCRKESLAANRLVTVSLLDLTSDILWKLSQLSGHTNNFSIYAYFL